MGCGASLAIIENAPSEINEIEKTEPDKLKALLLKNQLLSSTFLTRGIKDDDITKIVETMQPRQLVQDEILCKIGEESDQLFIITKGMLIAFDSRGTEVGKMKKGEVCGELGFLSGNKRKATLKAARRCIIYEIDINKYSKIIDYASFRTNLKEMSIFEGLSPEELDKLIENLDRVKFNSGEFILKKGDSPSDFFIIRNGYVKVTSSLTISQASLSPRKRGVVGSPEGMLSRDCYFGEESIIEDVPQQASYIAQGEVELFRLHGNTLQLHFPIVFSNLQERLLRAKKKVETCSSIGSNSPDRRRRSLTSEDDINNSSSNVDSIEFDYSHTKVEPPRNPVICAIDSIFFTWWM